MASKTYPKGDGRGRGRSHHRLLVAKLLLVHQLPEDLAKDDETSITSDVHVESIQKLRKLTSLAVVDDRRY